MSAPRPGFIHPSACIGSPPEHRDWKEGTHFHQPVIDPSAQVNAYVTVDGGMNAPTRVGARTLLMAHVHVGHDATVGADCELAPHTSVGGHVRLGDGVRVGQGALFRPFVDVGEGARIGMGAVVVRDVPAGEVWVGNPAHAIGETPQREAEGLLAWREWWDRTRGRALAS